MVFRTLRLWSPEDCAWGTRGYCCALRIGVPLGVFPDVAASLASKYEVNLLGTDTSLFEFDGCRVHRGRL